MPIERGKISAVLRSIQVDYFGESVIVILSTGRHDARQRSGVGRLRQLTLDERNGDGQDQQEMLAENAELLAERLAELLVSWDVLEDGEPIPPTKENLMTFPNALLGDIVSAIGEDLAPKARTSRR